MRLRPWPATSAVRPARRGRRSGVRGDVGVHRIVSAPASPRPYRAGLPAARALPACASPHRTRPWRRGPPPERGALTGRTDRSATGIRLRSSLTRRWDRACSPAPPGRVQALRSLAEPMPSRARVPEAGIRPGRHPRRRGDDDPRAKPWPARPSVRAAADPSLAAHRSCGRPGHSPGPRQSGPALPSSPPRRTPALSRAWPDTHRTWPPDARAGIPDRARTPRRSGPGDRSVPVPDHGRRPGGTRHAPSRVCSGTGGLRPHPAAAGFMIKKAQSPSSGL